MPTRFTKTAGSLAVAAAGLWLAALAMYWVTQAPDDWNTTLYLVWSAIVVAAGVLTFVATLGLRRRHGGSGVLGTVGLVFLGLGVVVSIISWAIPGWMMIQGIGMLLVVVAVRRADGAPRAASVAYGSGMLIGVTLHLVLTALKVGTPDSYGDYPLAWGTGLTVGLVVAVAGLFGIGSWLRGEESVDFELSDQAVNA
ncbi:MAG: hypothetical protein U9N56_02700 [Actinomycetota bacterium]|nr:hypothetical protein [Actinomycetota bacterium]